MNLAFKLTYHALSLKAIYPLEEVGLQALTQSDWNQIGDLFEVYLAGTFNEIMIGV
jgi:hypothetical protein